MTDTRQKGGGQERKQETGKQHRTCSKNITPPLLFLSSCSSPHTHRCSHVLPLPPKTSALAKRWRAAGNHGNPLETHPEESRCEEKKKGDRPSHKEEAAFITMTRAALGVDAVDSALHATSLSPRITSRLASFVLTANMEVL